MQFVLMLFAIFGLPWWLAAGSLMVRRGDLGRARVALAWAQGAGLVTLAALPVAFVQPWIPHSTSFRLDTQLWIPFVVPGVHAGGWTVTSLFEPLADSGVLGHRQTTMLSNWPVFFTLALLQTLTVGAVIGARLLARDRAKRGGKRVRRVDAVIAALTVSVSINAACNIAWPWWGS
jgi:hypothetical protein